MSAQHAEYGYQRKPLPADIGKVGMALLVVGALLVAAAFFLDKTRGTFNYVVMYMFLLSIGLGSLFIVAIEYLVGAVWSTPIRRVPEFIAGIIPFLALLAVPLLFRMHDLFHWSHHEAVEHDALLQGKEAYLNVPFFIGRVAFCFFVWILFYKLFTRNSLKQDETRDPAITTRGIKYAAIFIPLFAITLTMAAIDWLMSVEPHWFSTIFGVNYFAGTMISSLAVIALFVVNLNEKGYMHKGIVRDHYYNLGALMFAFNNFWAYTAFSQFMLIWYANLPEETFWFIKRVNGGWAYFGIFQIVFHFVLPFLLLMARPAKTNPKWLKFMAVWILVVHMVDLYWIVAPSFSAERPMIGAIDWLWMELGFVLLPIGLVMTVFARKAAGKNLVPIGDPKLARGLDFRL